MLNGINSKDKTYVNKGTKNYKLSFSKRIDDFNCKEWGKRKFINAYNNSVDRELFRI